MKIDVKNCRYKYVLFDFDGTLTDSSEGIFKSLSYAFEFYGHEKPGEDFLRKFIGPPLHYSFQTFCGFDDAHSREMTEKYRERYRVKGYLENTMYPGIDKTLSELKKGGVKLATASSKPLKFVDDICSDLGIKKYFDYLGGTTFDNTKESKADVIKAAMDALGADRDSTLMVGDRLFDIEGAHEAGIACCAVLYGFGSTEEFIDHNADYIVEKPQDILAVVQEKPPRKGE